MKFENLDLGNYYLIKIVKLHTDKDYLLKAFEEGQTYQAKTSTYTHDKNYNWTVNFMCFHKNGGFTQVNEFDADIEIVKQA